MADFSGKHYSQMSNLMAKAKPKMDIVSWNMMRAMLIRLFLDDNDRFDVGRFNEACKIEEVDET